ELVSDALLGEIATDPVVSRGSRGPERVVDVGALLRSGGEDVADDSYPDEAPPLAIPTGPLPLRATPLPSNGPAALLLAGAFGGFGAGLAASQRSRDRHDGPGGQARRPPTPRRKGGLPPGGLQR